MSRGDAVNQRNRTRVLPQPDCYDYVRRYYGVPAYIGMRVKVDGLAEGVLVKSRGDQYVYFRLDGETKTRGPYHPTDGIEYLVSTTPNGTPARDAVDPHGDSNTGARSTRG
jgi:hypothetical protein